MKLIRGIVVDDLPANVNWAINRLDPWFRRANWEVEWRKITDVDEAQRMVVTEPPFDIAVIDLLFPRTDVPDDTEARGLDLISEIQERSEHTFIFAISSGGPPRVDLFDNAERRGANKVLRRGEFSSESQENSPKAVATAAMEHLLNKGVVRVGTIRADPNDPGVQSLLHEVGAPTISQLFRRVIGVDPSRTHEIHIDFLSPGASGAHVCTVRSQASGSGQVRHVLKLSRAHSELSKEAKRSATAAKVIPTHLLISVQPERPVGPVNGWYAIGAPLQRGAQTFRTWLRTGPAPEVVEDVLETLFAEGLAPMYADTLDLRPVSTVDLLSFPHFRQRLVLEALEELKGTLTRPDGGNLPTVERLVWDIRGFVREGRLTNLLRTSLPAETRVWCSHGDLHGTNVLVYGGRHPTPILIDTSEFGEHHWATDPARFVVDVLMRSLDAGVESMFFTNFGTWRQVAAALGELRPPASPLRAAPGNEGTVAGLCWFMSNIRRCCPTLVSNEDFRAHHWEWRVALASYLLRITYHPDVPPPKRALAFVAAHDQLTATT